MSSFETNSVKGDKYPDCIFYKYSWLRKLSNTINHSQIEWEKLLGVGLVNQTCNRWKRTPRVPDGRNRRASKR
ncbi:hypothetical protein F511_18037 [Dorcoceras hygrometricum]|uniref:Uncharacterized protein n=1 Tax=Dorcoceras hygrometricum TaxID=472368 RepID=A0A2Z7AH91_9LAMI|nr:hypothetical protein F511_18037 [Dorcoceras hygrometricum]